MASPRQIATNPITQQCLRLVVTSRTCGGRELVVESTHNGPGVKPPSHCHLYQEELFEVLRDSLQVKLNGQLLQLTPGATLRIVLG